MEKAAVYLRERIERDESVIFAAWSKGTEQMAGFIQLYPSFSSISMQRLWILNDLFVIKSFRKQGVARRFMEAARDFADGTQAKGLELSTGKDNVFRPTSV